MNNKTFLNEKTYEEKLKDAERIKNEPGLRYCPEKYKDYDICLKSVKSNGYNLVYVPERYRDSKLCMEAIKTMLSDVSIYGYYSYDNIVNIFLLIPEHVRTSEFVLEIIESSEALGYLIEFVPMKNITKELCLKAIQYDASPSSIPKEFLNYEICKKGFESGNDMEDIECYISEDILNQLKEDGFIK